MASMRINFGYVACIDENLHEWTGKSLGREVHVIGSEPRVKRLAGPDTEGLLKLIGPPQRVTRPAGKA